MLLHSPPHDQNNQLTILISFVTYNFQIKSRVFFLLVFLSNPHIILHSFIHSRVRYQSFLHGILGGPFSCGTIMPLYISPEQLRNIRYERIVRVRISQEGTDAQQHLADGKCWTPLILENIETNSSIGVDVAVVDAGGEVYLGGFEGVVCGEVDIEEEYTPGVWGVVRSHDCCLPVEHIISDGTCGTVGWGIFSEIDKLFIDSFQ
mmetsp:Transcript_544/g.649  ORF Transcript_544/g.649 Transcript_544/m.649 type:complete len:205 (+) Transcript_544:223-837(+)